MIKIAPSILAADFGQLKNEIEDVKTADYLHIDVMDGQFVPNISIGPLVVQAIRASSNLIFDVHLMIKEPLKYVEQFKNAGADIITVHIETLKNPIQDVQFIKNLGVKVGISLNPDTDLSAITEILPMLDMVLIMSVYPGFGGQSFIENTYEKIATLRALDEKIDISVDGGIGAENIFDVSKAGANVFVAGTTVFKSENRKNMIGILRKKASEAKL